EAMRGKISTQGSGTPVDLATLKSQGLAKKKGNTYHLPLTNQHRGKIMVGDFTIIFQFVVPPPRPATPKLPASARGSLWQQLDWPFALALAAVFVLEAPVIVAFQYMDPPEQLTL